MNFNHSQLPSTHHQGYSKDFYETKTALGLLLNIYVFVGFLTNERHHEKTNDVVSKQVLRHKPSCTSTGDG